MSLKTLSVSCWMLFSLCVSPVRAGVSAAAEAYEQQRWDDVISLLQSTQADSDSNRLLALAYYNSQDIDAALPALRSALETNPGDPELSQALLDFLIADRLYSEAAPVIEELAASGAESQAQFGRARIAAAQDETDRASGILDELVDGAEPGLAQKSADLLIELLIADDQAGKAYEVAQRAIARDPDSKHAAGAWQ